MRVEIKKEAEGDYIRLIPENEEDTQQLLLLGPNYTEVVMGECDNGNVGIFCRR